MYYWIGGIGFGWLLLSLVIGLWFGNTFFFDAGIDDDAVVETRDPLEQLLFDWSKIRKTLESDQGIVILRFQEVVQYLKQLPRKSLSEKCISYKKWRRLARLILWDKTILHAMKDGRIPVLRITLEKIAFEAVDLLRENIYTNELPSWKGSAKAYENRLYCEVFPEHSWLID